MLEHVLLVFQHDAGHWLRFAAEPRRQDHSSSMTFSITLTAAVVLDSFSTKSIASKASLNWRSIGSVPSLLGASPSMGVHGGSSSNGPTYRRTRHGQCKFSGAWR